MESVKGTVRSVTTRQTKTGKTMFTIEIDAGLQYPVKISTMEELKSGEGIGEHTFYYDLGEEYENKYGGKSRTKWLRAVDVAPAGAKIDKFEQLKLMLTDLQITCNTILGRLSKDDEPPPEPKEEVELEDINF